MDRIFGFRKLKFRKKKFLPNIQFLPITSPTHRILLNSPPPPLLTIPDKTDLIDKENWWKKSDKDNWWKPGPLTSRRRS
jgi:hypothetical protein